MNHITLEQRYQIAAYMNAGMCIDDIAKQIGKNRSSIYRELNRNTSAKGKYTAKKAHELSTERKDRFVGLRKFDAACKKVTESLLKHKWSPKQIVGHCKRMGIAMVSHERIYQHIRQDKVNGGKLYLNCRHKLKNRKRPVGKHLPIANRVSINERPETVANKERFGDWEMDTIIGAYQQGAILTLTERATNFIFILKLEQGKNSKALREKLNETLLPYKNFVHTITTDNGTEFADHLEMKSSLDSCIYFANPYCSWEKGSIEHANKLIRQYIPKEDNLNRYTQAQLDEIQYAINSRPREKLDFDTPKNLFFNFVNGNVAFDG